MKAMIEISRETAQSIWQGGDAEVYELLDDGAESLIDGDYFDEVTANVNKFGIEGSLFGKPYDEKEVI